VVVNPRQLAYRLMIMQDERKIHIVPVTVGVTKASSTTRCEYSKTTVSRVFGWYELCHNRDAIGVRGTVQVRV
jgi:hypothetical protein